MVSLTKNLIFSDDDDSQVSRVVFRRLSQTTQTDALMGNLDETTGGRLIIRPKSVQVATWGVVRKNRQPSILDGLH